MEHDKRICDKCYHFECHPSGTSERCYEHLLNPYYLTKAYYEARRDGEKRRCKAFKHLDH